MFLNGCRIKLTLWVHKNHFECEVGLLSHVGQRYKQKWRKCWNKKNQNIKKNKNYINKSEIQLFILIRNRLSAGGLILGGVLIA